jgi:hypothetical protein
MQVLLVGSLSKSLEPNNNNNKIIKPEFFIPFLILKILQIFGIIDLKPRRGGLKF